MNNIQNGRWNAGQQQNNLRWNERTISPSDRTYRSYETYTPKERENLWSYQKDPNESYQEPNENPGFLRKTRDAISSFFQGLFDADAGGAEGSMFQSMKASDNYQRALQYINANQALQALDTQGYGNFKPRVYYLSHGLPIPEELKERYHEYTQQLEENKDAYENSKSFLDYRQMQAASVTAGKPFRTSGNAALAGTIGGAIVGGPVGSLVGSVGGGIGGFVYGLGSLTYDRVTGSSDNQKLMDTQSELVKIYNDRYNQKQQQIKDGGSNILKTESGFDNELDYNQPFQNMDPDHQELALQKIAFERGRQKEEQLRPAIQKQYEDAIDSKQWWVKQAPISSAYQTKQQQVMSDPNPGWIDYMSYAFPSTAGSSSSAFQNQAASIGYAIAGNHARNVLGRIMTVGDKLAEGTVGKFLQRSPELTGVLSLASTTGQVLSSLSQNLLSSANENNAEIADTYSQKIMQDLNKSPEGKKVLGEVMDKGYRYFADTKGYTPEQLQQLQPEDLIAAALMNKDQFVNNGDRSVEKYVTNNKMFDKAVYRNQKGMYNQYLNDMAATTSNDIFESLIMAVDVGGILKYGKMAAMKVVPSSIADRIANTTAKVAAGTEKVSNKLKLGTILQGAKYGYKATAPTGLGIGGEVIGTGVGAVAGGIKALDQMLVDHGINVGGKRLRQFAEMQAEKIGNKLANNLAATRITSGISKWTLATAATGFAEGQEEGKQYINNVNNLNGQDGSIEVPDLLQILKNDFNTGKRSFGGIWSMLTGAEGEFANDAQFKTNVIGGLVLGGLHTGAVNALGGVKDAVTGGLVKQYRADKYVAANLNVNRMASLTDIQQNKAIAEKALSQDFPQVFKAMDKLGDIYDMFGMDESKQLTDDSKKKANRVYVIANNKSFQDLMKTKGIETNTDEYNTAVGILSHVQDLKQQNQSQIKDSNAKLNTLFADPEIQDITTQLTEKLLPGSQTFQNFEIAHNNSIEQVKKNQPLLQQRIGEIKNTIEQVKTNIKESENAIKDSKNAKVLHELTEAKKRYEDRLKENTKNLGDLQKQYNDGESYIKSSAFDVVHSHYDALHQLRAYAKAIRDMQSVETIAGIRDLVFDTAKREKPELEHSKSNLITAYNTLFDQVKDLFKDTLQFDDKRDTDDVIEKTNFLESNEKEEQIQQHYRDLIFTKVDNDQLSKEEENLYDGVNVSKEDPLKLVYTPTVGDNSDLGKEMIKRYNALWNGEEENNADLSESEKTTKTSTQLPNAKPKNEKAPSNVKQSEDEGMGDEAGYTKEEVQLMGFSTDGNVVYDQEGNPISYIIGSKADPKYKEKEQKKPVEENKTIENAEGGSKQSSLLKIRFKNRFEQIRKINEEISNVDSNLDAVEQDTDKYSKEQKEKIVKEIVDEVLSMKMVSEEFRKTLSDNHITSRVIELDTLESNIESILNRCSAIFDKQDKEGTVKFLEAFDQYLDKKQMDYDLKTNDFKQIIPLFQQLYTGLEYLKKTVNDAINYGNKYDSKYDVAIANMQDSIEKLTKKLNDKFDNIINKLQTKSVKEIGKTKFSQLLDDATTILRSLDNETNLKYNQLLIDLQQKHLDETSKKQQEKESKQPKEKDKKQDPEQDKEEEKKEEEQHEEDQNEDEVSDGLQTVLDNSKTLNEYDQNRAPVEKPRGNRFKVIFDDKDGIKVYENASNLLPQRGNDSDIDKAAELKKYLELNINDEKIFEETIKKYSKNDEDGKRIALSYVKYRFLPGVINLITDQLTNTIQNKTSIIISNNIRDAIKRIFNRVAIKQNDATIKPAAFNKLLESRNRILEKQLGEAGWQLVASNVDLIGVLNGVNVFKNAEFLFQNEAGEFMIMNPTVSYKQMLRYDENTKKYVFTSNYTKTGSFVGERFSQKEYDLANADQYNELGEQILPGMFKKYAKLFVKQVKERDTNVVEDIDYIVASVLKNFVSKANLHVGDSADIQTNSLLKQYNTAQEQLKVDLAVLKQYQKNIPLNSEEHSNLESLINAAEDWVNYSLSADQLKSNDTIKENTNRIQEVVLAVGATLQKLIDSQKVVTPKKKGRAVINPSVMSTVASAIDKVKGYDKLVRTDNSETTPLFNTNHVKLINKGNYDFELEIKLDGKTYNIPLYVDRPSNDGHIESQHKTLVSKLTKMFDFVKTHKGYSVRPNNISLSLGEFIDEHDKDGNPVLKTLVERGLVTKEQLYTITVDGSVIGLVNADNTVVNANGEMISNVARGVNNQKLIAGQHVFFFNDEKYNGKKHPKKIWTKVMPQSVIDQIPILIKDKYYSTIQHEKGNGMYNLLDCMIFSGDEDTQTTDPFIFRFFNNNAIVQIGEGDKFDVTSDNFVQDFTNYIHQLQKNTKYPYMPHFRVGEQDANTVVVGYRVGNKMNTSDSDMFKFVNNFFKTHPNIEEISVGTDKEAFTLFKRSQFEKDSNGRHMTGLGWFIDSGIMLSTYDGSKNKLINTSNFHVYNENGNQIDDSEIDLPSSTKGIEETKEEETNEESINPDEDILAKINSQFGTTKVVAESMLTEEEQQEEEKSPTIVDQQDIDDENETKQAKERANSFKKKSKSISRSNTKGNYQSTVSGEPISALERSKIIERVQKIIGRNIPVEFHNGVIETLSNGASVLGQCMVDSISLSDRMIPGVEYHEAFHRVLGLTLKNSTRNSLYKYFIKKSGQDNLSNRDIEEGLCDMYMAYRNDSAIKLSFNIKSLFNSIVNFCKFIKDVGNFKMIRTFLLTDFGWYANRTTSEENIKHFNETFGEVARYSIYDDKSKSRIDIGDSFVNFTQFYDLVKGIVNTVIRNQNINGITVGVENMDLSLDTILKTMMKNRSFSKLFDKNDHASNTEMAKSVRQLFTGTTIVKKQVYNKTTQQRETVEKEFPIWDVVKQYMADYIKSLNQNIIINEQRNEDADKKENDNVDDTGIQNYEKASYEVNPLTRVSQKVKFLCSTFAKYKKVKKNGKISYVLNTEENVYGFPAMHSVNEVYVKLVKAFNKCKGLDDLNIAVNKNANRNDIMFQFAKFWNSIYKDMIDEQGNINHDVRNQLVQIQQSLAQVINSYYICQMTQTANKNSQEYKFNFFDTRINTYAKDYGMNIYATILKGNHFITSEQIQTIDEETTEKIFKRKFSKTGKADIMNAVKYLNQFVKVVNGESVSLNNSAYDINDIESVHELLDSLCEALKPLGIPVKSSDILEYIYQQYESISSNTITDDSILCEQITNFLKNVSGINDFKKTLSRLNNKSEFANITNIQKLYYSRFVRTLGTAIAVRQQADQSFSTLALGGKRIYNISQPCQFTLITDDVNDRDSKLWSDINSNRLTSVINTETGERKGSVILKKMESDENLMLSPIVINGFKTYLPYDKGSEFKREGEIENILNRFIAISRGCILSPTMSDKTTWFALRGIQLPGFEYPMYGDNNSVIKGNAPKIFLQPNGKLLLSITDDNVINQIKEYIECELESVKFNNSNEQKKFFKEHPELKIANYHKGNLGGNSTRFRTFCEYYEYQIDEEQTKEKNKIVYKKDAKGNLIENTIIVNDTNKTSDQCIKTVEKVLNRFQDPKLQKQYMRMIVSNIVRHSVEDCLQELSDSGIINTTNGLNKVKNSFLDATLVNRIKSMRSDAVSNLDQDAYSVYAYLQDMMAKNIMGVTEFERLYIVNPAFYKWKYKNSHLSDAQSDEYKRLGAFVSTGDQNCEQLTDIPSHYRCLQLSDEYITSDEVNGTKLKDLFYNSNLRDVYTARQISPITDEFYKNRSKITAILEKHQDELNESKDAKQITALEKQIQAQYDRIDKLESEYKKKCTAIYDKVYSKNENGEYNTKLTDIEEEQPELAQKIRKKSTREVDEHFVHRNSTADSGICVTDATSFISPTMAKNLLQMRGAYSDDIDTAFKILEGEIKVSPEEVLDAEHLIQDAQIVIGKYSAAGYRMENNQMINYYNKTALAILTKHQATSRLARLYQLMHDGVDVDEIDNNTGLKTGKKVHKQIDMMMFDSAVKAGSRASVSVNENGDLIGIDGKPADLSNYSYEQPYRNIRHQLNTDPNEKEKMKLGTQTMKIVQSNLRLYKNYNSIFDDQLGTLTGEQIRDRINDNINALTDMHADELLQQLGSAFKLRRFLKKQLTTRGADQSIIETLNDPKIPIEALSNRKFIESVIISEIGKNVIDTNLGGKAFIQKTSFGAEGGKVIDDESYPTPLYGGKRLEMINNKNSMDICVTMDYLDPIIKEFVGVDAFNEMTFEQKRQFLLDKNLIGENADPFVLGYRIPTQAESSIHSMRIADILPDTFDTIMVPREFTVITGSDFDVDKLFLIRHNVNTKAQTKDDLFKFEEGTEEYHENDLLNLFRLLLTDIDNSVHILYRSIDDDTSLMKDFSEQLPDIEAPHVPAFGMGYFMKQVRSRMAYQTGKTGIAPYALNNNNQIPTQLYQVTFKPDAKHLLETLKMNDLSNNLDKDDQLILSWLSCGVNGHVDLVKDPFVTKENINMFTYNMSNLFIRTGNGAICMRFLNQPAIRMLAKRFMNETSSKIKGLRNKTDVLRECMDVVSNKIKQGNTTEYKNLIDWILGNHTPSSQDIETYPFMGEKDALNSYLLSRFKDIMEGDYLQNVISKGINLNDVDGSQSTTEIISGENKMTVGEIQALSMKLWEKLNPYADNLASLVKYSKIETKKYGSNFGQVFAYIYGYNKFRSNNKFDTYSMDNLFDSSYQDNKTTWLFGILSSLLEKECIAVNGNVQDWVNQMLQVMFKDRTDISADYLGQLIDSISAIKKSRFFYDDRESSPKGYAVRNGISVRDLFYGNNTVQDIYNELNILANTDDSYSDLLSNPLFERIIPIDTGDSEKPKTITVANTDANEAQYLSTIKRGFEMLCSDIHPEVREFANKLAVYAYYTSGDNGGFGSIMRFVSEDWRSKQGMTNYVKAILNRLNSEDAIAEAQEDVADVVSNCRDCSIIAPLKKLRYRKDGANNFITLKASSTYGSMPVLMINASNQNGNITIPSTDNDPIITIEVNKKKHIYATYKAVGTVKMIFNGKPVDYTIYGLKRPSSIKTDKNITIYSFNSDMRFNPFEIDPQYYADSKGFQANVQKLISVFDGFVDRTLNVNNVTDELYRQFEGSSSTVDITSAKADMFQSKGTFDFNESFFKRFPQFEKMKEFLQKTKTNSPAETYLKLLSYLIDPKFIKDEEAMEAIKQFRHSAEHSTNKEYLDMFDDITKYINKDVATEEFATKLARFIINRYAKHDNLYAENILNTGNATLTDDGNESGNEYVDIQTKATEKVRRSILNRSELSGLEQKEEEEEYDESEEPTNEESTENVLLNNIRYSREIAEQHKDWLFIFTDNTDRTSGGTNYEEGRYKDKYGEGGFGSRNNPTTAVIRGLDNAFPISTMKWFYKSHSGATVNTSRFTDNDFQQFKEVIDDEFNDIKQAWDTGEFTKIVIPGSDGLFNSKIASITKTRTPKIFDYLKQKEAELMKHIGVSEEQAKPNSVQDIKEKITKAISDESLQTTEEEGKKVEEKCGVDSSQGAGAAALRALRNKHK